MSSWTPSRTSCFASVMISSSRRARCSPRRYGMRQYEQWFEQPSDIFRYAYEGGVEMRRGIDAVRRNRGALETSKMRLPWTILGRKSLIFLKSALPNIASISGKRWKSSLFCSCGRHPQTMSFWFRDLLFVMEETACKLSVRASLVNAHVFIIMTSARDPDVTNELCLSESKSPSSDSESTRFLAHPREIVNIFTFNHEDGSGDGES